MKTAVFIFGFLGAGLVGAVASRELFPTASPTAETPPAWANVEARVDDLSGQVERLSAELRARRDAAIVPVAPPSVGAAGAPTALEDTTSIPGSPAATVSDEKIEKKVEETIAKITRERQIEKARQVEMATRKKEWDWLLAKQKELDLTDYQVEEFAKMLIARRQRMAGMKGRWKDSSPEQQAQLKTEMEDYSRELRGELRKLLSADQYSAIMEAKGRK